MSDDDERKVHDLSLRRHQKQDDPILQLANQLTKLVAETAGEMEPANQLVAIELTARAMFETIRHARGEDALNEIVVEFQNKCRFYTMEWPKHDQTQTVYDIDREADTDRAPAKIVSLIPETDE